ncbi:MAG: ATP-binding protein [Rhodopirellula sp.]|nr:ATP-binding protein [Rhodopirellula sp.]
MSNDGWVWQHEYCIPSKAGAGQCVVEDVLAQLQQHQWDDKDVFGIHLAVEEALVNAIKHGNKLDMSKQVTVNCSMSPALFRIAITDEGEGFDLDQVPDPTDEDNLDAPSGRGIMLMRSFMSRVLFNDRGNHVVLEKDREAVPAD